VRRRARQAANKAAAFRFRRKCLAKRSTSRPVVHYTLLAIGQTLHSTHTNCTHGVPLQLKMMQLVSPCWPHKIEGSDYYYTGIVLVCTDSSCHIAFATQLLVVDVYSEITRRAMHATGTRHHAANPTPTTLKPEEHSGEHSGSCLIA
jgi:hypothetical protein